MENGQLQYAAEAQLLRICDVVSLTTLSKSCINDWVIKGKFPKPIAFSPTLKAWRLKDVTEWIDERHACSGGSVDSRNKPILKVVNE